MTDIRRPENMERITTPELAQAFIDEQVKLLREQIGSDKVLLALSGGVDSSVVAALLIKAVGDQLVAVGRFRRPGLYIFDFGGQARFPVDHIAVLAQQALVPIHEG